LWTPWKEWKRWEKTKLSISSNYMLTLDSHFIRMNQVLGIPQKNSRCSVFYYLYCGLVSDSWKTKEPDHVKLYIIVCFSLSSAQFVSA
jgi:hypothetical protein